jgi:hypothetical protein
MSSGRLQPRVASPRVAHRARQSIVLILGLAGVLMAHHTAQADEAASADDLEPLVRELLQAIEALSDYRAGGALPPVFQLPQARLEEKVCEAPCNVDAAYLPREGIFLSGHLQPLQQVPDRAALLHELVHYLQQGHARFAGLPPCERERAKEREAVAIQNAYLAALNRSERAQFNDDFDCEREEADSR